MARPKKTIETTAVTTETHHMEIQKINLEKPTEEVLRAIQAESDLSVLHQTMVQEKNLGKRTAVLGALEQKAATLRSYGEGSEGPLYDLPGYEIKKEEPLFNTMTRLDAPRTEIEHDYGHGAKSEQKLSAAERIHGEMEKQEAKRRMNTPDELFEVQERTKNGSIIFKWGHLMQSQKEVKNADGKVLVRWRPSLVFLKACPRCGRVNVPESGMAGRCHSCHLDMIPYVKTELAKNPSKYQGIELEYNK